MKVDNKKSGTVIFLSSAFFCFLSSYFLSIYKIRKMFRKILSFLYRLKLPKDMLNLKVYLLYKFPPAIITPKLNRIYIYISWNILYYCQNMG